MLLQSKAARYYMKLDNALVSINDDTNVSKLCVECIFRMYLGTW